MDVSVDGVRDGLTSWLPWRRETEVQTRGTGALARVHVAYRVARWEAIVAVVALFALGRTPFLFLRLHTTELFWAVRALWQDDLVIFCAMAVVEVAVIAIAVRRANVDSLLRQPFLLAFLGFAWLSMAWSVEPDVTMRRSFLLAGAAGVGWYVGDRFSLREQIRLVSWLGWSAIGSTAIALIFWRDLATRTTINFGTEWSGIYVNRNSLGLVLSMGFLATLFFIRTTERKVLVRIVAVVEFYTLLATKSRTGLVGIAVAVAIAGGVALLRRSRSEKIGTIAGAYVVCAVFATMGLVVHAYWATILRRLGRDPDLTGRTFIWQLVKWFSRLHPVRGWGFEAIWANEHAIGQAQAAHGSLSAKGIPGGYPFAAHNGYYEVLLGVGYIGLALLIGFLGLAVWRAFRHAWFRRDVESLWPLAFLTFALVVNFSESLFVSGEALFVLTVAASVSLVKVARPGPPVPVAPALQHAPDPPVAAPADVRRGRRGRRG